MIEQQDLTNIAELVEQYVDLLRQQVSEAVEHLDGRLRAVEHVAATASYRAFIANEAVHLGLVDPGAVHDGSTD